MTAEQLEELANGFAMHLHSEETIQYLAKIAIKANNLLEASEHVLAVDSASYFGQDAALHKRNAHNGARRELIKAITAYREASQ